MSDGLKAAQTLIDAFRNVEKASERVAGQIDSGRMVSQRFASFDLLREEINATFGSIEQAPAEIQEAYKTAELQFIEASAKIRALNTPLD